MVVDLILHDRLRKLKDSKDQGEDEEENAVGRVRLVRRSNYQFREDGPLSLAERIGVSGMMT